MTHWSVFWGRESPTCARETDNSGAAELSTASNNATAAATIETVCHCLKLSHLR
jgi:hypothetical protein